MVGILDDTCLIFNTMILKELKFNLTKILAYYVIGLWALKRSIHFGEDKSNFLAVNVKLKKQTLQIFSIKI